RRLIERMKKIIASQVTDTPTKDALLQYYQESKGRRVSRYKREKSVRLVHGYFSVSNHSLDKMIELHRQWINGELGDKEMQLLADSVLVNSTVYITGNAEIKLFGEDTSALISDVKLGVANKGFLPVQKGPVGYHFIRVINIRPSHYRPYVEIEKQLKSDYIDEKRKEMLVSTLAELRAEYSVIQ
ncbi:MAG: peptidyl-prolyl cis-trans isomerase, partial [Pseudomonadales bacterium]|nr:peptidyl-prolyl cis-trans isomerase [Pseudomonadales bacterium]